MTGCSFDRDVFEGRAAIAKFEGAMNRFEAETLAASEQGLARWQALREIRRAELIGTAEERRHRGRAVAWRSGADDVPILQPEPAEQEGCLPERHANE